MTDNYNFGVRPRGCAEADIDDVAPDMRRGEFLTTVDNTTDKNPQRLLIAKAEPEDGDDLLPVGVYVDVPSSSTATGYAGQMAYDGSYLYICRDTDTWERIAWDIMPW